MGAGGHAGLDAGLDAGREASPRLTVDPAKVILDEMNRSRLTSHRSKGSFQPTRSARQCKLSPPNTQHFQDYRSFGLPRKYRRKISAAAALEWLVLVLINAFKSIGDQQAVLSSNRASARFLFAL
jgi:hypothetical protein